MFSSTIRGNTTAIGYEAKNDESTMEKVICILQYTYYFLFNRSIPYFYALYMFSCPHLAIPFSGVLKSANYSTDTTTAPFTKTLTKTSTTGKLFLRFLF